MLRLLVRFVTGWMLRDMPGQKNAAWRLPMATGAGDRYWEYQGLPSVLKHELLRRYLPIFAGKTGSKTASVVYLDGYAGRGRYDNGTAGSAELILKVAEDYTGRGISFRLFFHETKRKNYAVLKPVVDEYKARGVQAEASPDEVIKGLGKVIDAARGLPLFMFLDPCGVGIPFSDLTAVLSGPRRDKWPPTEVLLNFSLDAVRRIGGHVNSATPNEKTMARLDAALDGDWWRDVIRQRGVNDDAVREIVEGFMDRLGKATKMAVVACPVSRAPSHKPVYYLVLCTRNPLGIWYFGDSAARADEKWWDTLEAKEAVRDEDEGIEYLFDIPHLLHPSLKEVEARAVPVIAENIARLAEEHGQVEVGKYPSQVFGDNLGTVSEVVVRAAIKQLHADGRTPSTGVGGKIPKLIVARPTR
jgi:three-Cys-motif partner protein